MYEPLLPSLFAESQVDACYFLLPGFVERARHVADEHVERLNGRLLPYALPAKWCRAIYYRRKIQQFVDELRPDAVVFNTVEPPAFLRVFRQIRHPLKLGVVHNPQAPWDRLRPTRIRRAHLLSPRLQLQAPRAGETGRRIPVTVRQVSERRNLHASKGPSRNCVARRHQLQSPSLPHARRARSPVATRDATPTRRFQYPRGCRSSRRTEAPTGRPRTRPGPSCSAFT